jgi:outer membrane protein OmpA-like peptidoglycan-associated protein
MVLKWGTIGAVLLTLAGGVAAQRLDLTGRRQLDPEEIVHGLAPGRTSEGRAAGRAAVALTVEFAFNSADLAPEAAPTLRAIAQALQSPELAGRRVQIEGHTDSVGSDRYNLHLSARRARRVQQYLVRHYRLPPARLLAVGRGEAEPIADNATAEGRQKNRRVELVNLGPQHAQQEPQPRKEGTIFLQPPGALGRGGRAP